MEYLSVKDKYERELVGSIVEVHGPVVHIRCDLSFIVVPVQTFERI